MRVPGWLPFSLSCSYLPPPWWIFSLHPSTRSLNRILPVFHTKDWLLSWVKGIVYENLQLVIPVYYGFLFVCLELWPQSWRQQFQIISCLCVQVGYCYLYLRNLKSVYLSYLFVAIQRQILGLINFVFQGVYHNGQIKTNAKSQLLDDQTFLTVVSREAILTMRH